MENVSTATAMEKLPGHVRTTLETFVEASKSALQSNLSSVVLFGSAAEARLRLNSDVNLMLVLKKFEVAQVDLLREPLRTAHAAIQLNAMFLLESELPVAAEVFAVKFDDIQHRHVVLHGPNPFNDFHVPREAAIQRLRQVLVNLTLRLRERYALLSLREEQLSRVIADASGPIRACANTILNLEGKNADSPKQALQNLSERLPGGPWQPVLSHMSQAREERTLPPGEGPTTLLGLLNLLQAMTNHVQSLK